MAVVVEAREHVRTRAEWEELYLALRSDLTRALVAASSSYEGVEDAIQDAFAAALRGGPPPATNVEGWLFTVALNALRRGRRRARLFGPFGSAPRSDTRELDAALARSDAVRALRALPERERTLIVAKYYVGLTQDEIAKALGLRRGTVSSAISRAVARLREIEEGKR